MTRLQGTPYDRLAAPASIAETRERARARIERLALAARLAEFDGKNVAELTLTMSEHVVTRLGLLAKAANAEPEAFGATMLAEAVGALGEDAVPRDAAGVTAAPALPPPARAEAAGTGGKTAGTDELKARIGRLEQDLAAQRRAADKAGRRECEAKAALKTATTELAMAEADLAAAKAAPAARESALLADVSRLEAELGAATSAIAEAIADRDHARRERDAAQSAAAPSAEARGAVDLAALEEGVARRVVAAPASAPEPAPTKARTKARNKAPPRAAAKTPAPKGAPYRWPKDFGR